MVLLVFFLIDLYFFHRETKAVRHQASVLDEPEVSGLHNVVFLFIILGAVFIAPPAPLLLREAVMWAAAMGSYFTTKKEIHEKNEFHFPPIIGGGGSFCRHFCDDDSGSRLAGTQCSKT